MDPIITPIIVAVIIALIPSVIMALMHRKWQKTDNKAKVETEENKIIKEMQRSIWRLNKTVLITAKIIDDQTTKNHPELTSSLEDIATELLKESDNS